MKTIPKKSFGSLKLGEKKVAAVPKKVDVKKITEEIFDLKDVITPTLIDVATTPLFPVKTTGFIPKSECLMTMFYLLTNKSFPRKGAGKSTKIKMLDAIIMAALDKKLILQEEEDAKSKNH